eukprot:Skav201431  [mRNA]  locus=scaffold201:281514:282956:- [translate_table: standard]
MALRWFLPLVPVLGQIRVLAPPTVVENFDATRGWIFGSTSTFGAPFYGDRVYGRLVYGVPKKENHCSEEDYEVPKPETHVAKDNNREEVRLINIVMVERGTCSFVTKVKVAQKKEAHAVIIVDMQGSTRTSRDIQDIIVADDGYGANVDIPSVLISRQEGQKLIDPILADPETQVIVELSWDIPAENVVQVDLWMSSASLSSQKFLKEFSPKREALSEYLRFMPHYHVFSMDTSKDYKELCSDVSGKYCAEDPDGSGSVTGYLVLMEDVRQLCIHDLYTQSMDQRISHQRGPHFLGEPALFAREWWQYVTHFLDECPLDGKTDGKRFGEECSKRVMRKFNINVEKVEACVAQNKEFKLQQQLTFTAWSPRALRINGWRYKGQMDADLVTRAICAGFVQTPQKCTALLEPRDPFMPFMPRKDTEAGVSFSQMVEAIVATALVGICIMYFYKRALTRHVHTALREEVMLEVQSEMARYRQLE